MFEGILTLYVIDYWPYSLLSEAQGRMNVFGCVRLYYIVALRPFSCISGFSTHLDWEKERKCKLSNCSTQPGCT